VHRLTRILLVCSAFLVMGGSALASVAPVDPSIILRDPSCDPYVTCVPINMSNFSFDVGPTGGGLYNFTNNLGFTLTSLTFIFENPGGITNGNIDSAVNCQVLSYFSNCSKSVLSNGAIRIFFSGVGGENCSGDSDDDHGGDADGGNNGHNECGGIGSGATFTLDLFDQFHHHDKKTGGWVSGSSVAGIAAVPEPGTLLLLLTGFSLLSLRKRQ
jgi:hypothetical protein